MKIKSKLYKKYFPFNKIRKCQKKAIKFILNSYINSNKKYVILDAGTGVGKSAIAVTISRFLSNLNKTNNIKNKVTKDNIVYQNLEKELEKKKFQNKRTKTKDKKEELENIDDLIYLNSSYFLTTQKILQTQYVNDFHKIDDIEDIVPSYEMKTIASAKNYKCSFYSEISCSQGRRSLKIVNKDTPFFKNCSKHCKYKNQKNKFLEKNTDGVTNFQYFLAETMYSKEFKPKELLILDEAHNIYQELSDFIDIEITKNMIEKINIQFPKLENLSYLEQKKIVSKWVIYEFEPSIMKTKKEIEKQIKKEIENNNESIDSKHVVSDKRKFDDSDEENDFNKNKILEKDNDNVSENLKNLVKKCEYLDKYACKTRRFLKYYNANNWVINLIYEKKNNNSDDLDSNSSNSSTNSSISCDSNNIDYEIHELTKIQFKPIDISDYSKELIFDYGNKVLMMSATILDKNKFCKLIGINSNDVDFISIPSPFPPENKPIMYCPVGNMGLKNIDYSLPKLVKTIRKILKIHKNDKGIIHCHSYKIVKYIKENLNSNRLLEHDSKNRDKILKKHIKIKKPSVLLSPSMEEGVNLKDNISRFQIICKIPYPFLGDRLVKERMMKWKWWYSFETIKKIVQSIGRSIRSKTDHAKTYILDSCWETFYFQNKNNFPNDFQLLFK